MTENTCMTYLCFRGWRNVALASSICFEFSGKTEIVQIHVDCMLNIGKRIKKIFEMGGAHLIWEVIRVRRKIKRNSTEARQEDKAELIKVTAESEPLVWQIMITTHLQGL